jgi:hypothetical protein
VEPFEIRIENSMGMGFCKNKCTRIQLDILYVEQNYPSLKLREDVAPAFGAIKTEQHYFTNGMSKKSVYQGYINPENHVAWSKLVREGI